MKKRNAKAAVKFMRRDLQIKFNESDEKREREVEKSQCLPIRCTQTHNRSDINWYSTTGNEREYRPSYCRCQCYINVITI